METKTIYLITINGDVFRAVDDEEQAKELMALIDEVFEFARYETEIVNVRKIELLTFKNK